MERKSIKELREKLQLLGYRFGDALAMQIAYKTFLNKEIILGPQHQCADLQFVEDITHRLLVTYYSFVYSLFDSSGTDFIKITEPYASLLPQDAKTIRSELIEIWDVNKNSFEKLRHNAGFHGSKKFKGYELAYTSLADVHPQVAEFIMNHFKIFFLELDLLFMDQGDKGYNFLLQTKESLFKKSGKIKNDLKDQTFNDKMKAAREKMSKS